MKKTFLAIAFLVLCNGLAQAQTKEETKSWLKEKLQSYLVKGTVYYGTYSNIKVESLNECEIVITYLENQVHQQSGFKTEINNSRRIIASTASIVQVDPYFKYSDKKVKQVLERNVRVQTDLYYNKQSTFNGSLSSEFADWFALTIDKREANIQDRVMKAFAHLATFCPNKKEVF